MIDPLSDVPPEKGFWFCNGSRAMNLYQLVDTIEHTNDGVFAYHVSNGRNDFAAWIKDVIEDERLVRLVEHEGEKRWFVEKVRARIKELEDELTKRILGQ